MKMSKSLKIVCTVTNDLQFDQRMHRICSSLEEAGYEVCLVGRKLNGNDLPKRNYKLFRFHCFFKKGKLFYLEFNFRLLFLLLFHFRKYNIIYSVDLDTLLAGSVSSILSGKKLVYDAHEYFTELPELTNRPLTRKIWTFIAKISIPKASLCITVGNELAKQLSSLYHKKFFVVRNLPFALAHTASEEKGPQAPFILIYQGMLNEARGLEEMLEAMVELQHHNIQLWLIGEGDLSQKLRKMVVELSLDKSVIFYGFQSPDNLKRLTAKADLGINLLRNQGLNYYYSLANKFFDYVQSEIPSVNMSFPEYQYHNSLYEVSVLIPDLERKTISDSILHIKNNPTTYRQLQLNCKAAKKEWIWEKESKQLLHALQSL